MVFWKVVLFTFQAILKRPVVLVFSNGCVTSEDMLWKLDALQSFILELHWPDEVFAEHLTHRLKLMSADMIEAAAKRWVRFKQIRHFVGEMLQL